MRTLAELDAMIDGIRAAPAESGVVELIVRRPAVDERETVSESVWTWTRASSATHGASGGAAARRMAPRIRRRSSP